MKQWSNAYQVTLGKDAPISREAAGTVTSDSLAAESYNKGGAFSENVGLHPEEHSPSSSSGSKSNANTDPNGDSAPGYIASQYIKYPKGPHGKNLKEGDFGEGRTEDGLKKALQSEPGSMDDPSRLAEQQFQLKRGAPGRDGGERQYELATESKFDNLDRDVSA